MIIACPACNTRYVVPDTAIGAEGRTVRCAKCKHSWFQDGPDLEADPGSPPASAQQPVPAPAPAATPARQQAGPAPVGRPASREVSVAPPRPTFTGQSAPSPTDSPRASGTAIKQKGERSSPKQAERNDYDPDLDSDRVPDFDTVEPPYGNLRSDREDVAAPDFDGYDDGGSRFDYAPPFRPRRNWIKLWTWAAAIFAILALGTIAAVNYLGVPDWVPVQRPLFAMAEPDLTLEFPVEEQERRTLANGTEFFGARIIVSNTARQSRDVPPILIVLRDARERIVYSWEVVPPQAELAPGETMTINEAITDVPKAAVFADIGWAPR